MSSSAKKAPVHRGPTKSIPKRPSQMKQEQYKYHDGIPNQLTFKSSSKETKAKNSTHKRKYMSSIQPNLKRSIATPVKTPKMSNSGPSDEVDSLVYSFSKYNVQVDGTIIKTKNEPAELKFENPKSTKLNRELAKLQMGVAYKYKTRRKKQKKN
jgi:hypothetical protein